MKRARLDASIFLGAEHERRAREDATEPELNAGLELALLPSCRVKLHHAGELGLRHWTTECVAGERRENLRRASVLLVSRGWAAGEASLAARSGAGTCRVERTGNCQRFDVWPARRVIRPGRAAQERPQALATAADLPDERGTNCMRTCGDRHAHLQTCVDRIRTIG